MVSREDAENDLLAQCRLLADSKDPRFGDDFVETLTTYESQEGKVKVLSHKVNGIIIAFLSAKNYIFSMLDSIQESSDGGPAPVEVFSSDIRSTFLSVKEEIAALEEEEAALDHFIKKHSPLQWEGASSSPKGGLSECQSVLQALLDKYVLAEGHVKEEVKQEFAKLERLFEKKPNGSLPKLRQSSKKASGLGGGSSVTSSFLRARNEAARISQNKGRKALLKEISQILPHVKYSALEKQNEQFQQQQQQRTRSQEMHELHKRELKRVAKKSEEKLQRSSDDAKKKATSAVARLEWEVRADVSAQHLKHFRKEKAIDDEIRSFMAMEDEKRSRLERERRVEAIMRERDHQKQLLAVYHDEVERKKAAQLEEQQMKNLLEEQQRALNLVETEKRVKYRQQLDSVRNEERQAKEELQREEELAKRLRLERLAASVAPEVEADPARARAHTFASASMLEGEDEEGEGKAFNSVHGYFDDRLFQDQRFRIGEALRAAGLHTTDYGRSVLTDIKSNVQHRPDMRTTFDKMRNA